MQIFSDLLAHKELAIALTALSIVMFVGSLLSVPWLVARAPRDFFSHAERTPKPARPLGLRVLKNLAGGVLVAAGALMLVLPGQGILTLIVGLALLDLPGKHALLVRLAKRPSVMRGLNYVRRRRGREPFDAPP